MKSKNNFENYCARKLFIRVIRQAANLLLYYVNVDYKMAIGDAKRLSQTVILMKPIKCKRTHCMYLY